MGAAEAEALIEALARLMPEAPEAEAEDAMTERVMRSEAEPEARPERDEASSSSAEALRRPEAEPDTATAVAPAWTSAVVGAASVATVLTAGSAPVLSWAARVSASREGLGRTGRSQAERQSGEEDRAAHVCECWARRERAAVESSERPR